MRPQRDACPQVAERTLAKGANVVSWLKKYQFRGRVESIPENSIVRNKNNTPGRFSIILFCHNPILLRPSGPKALPSRVGNTADRRMCPGTSFQGVEYRPSYCAGLIAGEMRGSVFRYYFVSLDIFYNFVLTPPSDDAKYLIIIWR